MFENFKFLLDTDPIVQFVVLILIIMSVLSWSIFLYKRSTIVNMHKRLHNLQDTLLFDQSKQHILNLYDVYKSKYKNDYASTIFCNIIEYNQSNISFSSSKAIRNINIIISEVSISLNKYMNFLASTASISPFIGLFGTVWGIMNSFFAISQNNSANNILTVLAPSISEALMATATGLFVAIPALIFYNYILSRNNEYLDKIDNFASKIADHIEDMN